MKTTPDAATTVAENNPPGAARRGIEDRYAEHLSGRLMCFDRLLIYGTMQRLHNPATVAGMLTDRVLSVFDLKELFEPWSGAIRANALALSKKHKVPIRFVASCRERKEDLVKAILAERGEAPGLVCILSAMENCTTFAGRKAGGPHQLDWIKTVPGRCVHYYFYFIDEELGLLHVRVPSWFPSRLQFCLNGHQRLACALRQGGIGFTLEGNAFTFISDWPAAQALSDQWDVPALEQILHRYAALCCPPAAAHGRYYLSVAQAELALDLAFTEKPVVQRLTENLCRHSMLTTRIGQMAAWFGKKLSPEAEATSGFRTVSYETWCVRHYYSAQSLKLYNKGCVLRLECASSDITFYRHHREVARRDGTSECKVAPLKKQLFSLRDLRGLMSAACERFLKHLSVLEDPEPARHNLDQITRPVRDEKARSWRGLNFFHAGDLQLVLALNDGSGSIRGWTARRLREALGAQHSGSQISRMLRRLREHGLLKRAAKTFTYYLTVLGQSALIAALKLRTHLILPALHPAIPMPV